MTLRALHDRAWDALMRWRAEMYASFAYHRAEAATRAKPAAADPAGGPYPLKALSSTAEIFQGWACRNRRQ